MFYYLNIPFETCFGKNRYQSDLFPAIISTHPITHVFFYFADDQLSDHYLFVSNSDMKYNVDERAWQLENTKIIHLKKDDPFSADKPSVQIRAMPQSQADHNRRTVTWETGVEVGQMLDDTRQYERTMREGNAFPRVEWATTLRILEQLAAATPRP